jgi:hypothetical protein
LVEWFLHEMNVSIARADELAGGRERSFARHQQQRQPAAKDVMHRGRGVGGADVDVHQHALPAAGDEGVARRHVGSGVLVRTADDGRQRVAALSPMRNLLDDRGVVGAEIAEKVFDPELAQPLQEEIGGRIARAIGLALQSCVHDTSRILSTEPARLCHPGRLCEAHAARPETTGGCASSSHAC